MGKKTEESPRYDLKEITVNGFNRNGTFVTKDKIESYFGKTDVYQSYYNYTDEIIEHYNAKNSIGGFQGKIEADNLIIDLDFDLDLNAVHSIVKKLIESIESKYSTKTYRVYFSGNKGFHVEMPTFLFGSFVHPSIALNLLHRQLAIELIYPISDEIIRIEEEYKNNTGMTKSIFDLSIYDKTRLIRLENTKNSKSGLFKIRLTRDELFSLNIDEIKKLAKDQRDNIVDEFKTEPNGALSDLYYQATKKVVSPKFTHNDNKNDFAFDEENVAAIHFSGYEIIRNNCKWLDRMFSQTEFSHVERTQLGQFFQFFGSQGEKKLHELLGKAKNYNPKTTDYHINKILMKKFKAPNCETLCGNNKCPAMQTINKKSNVAFACISRLVTFNETFIVQRFTRSHPNLMYSVVDESFYEYKNGVY